MPRTDKDMAKLKAQFEALSNAFADLGGNAIEENKASAREQIAELRRQITELSEVATEKATMAKEKIQDTTKKANKYAHENPWTVIGSAAAAGRLLGLAARGGHSHEEEEWD
ncbi:MAG: hypothetical protein WCO52_05045 [bacterium]